MSLESLLNAAKQAVEKKEFFKQAWQMTATMLTAETVDAAELERRYMICADCEVSKISRGGELVCGDCGCSVIQDADKLTNKLRYKTLANGESVCPRKKF